MKTKSHRPTEVEVESQSVCNRKKVRKSGNKYNQAEEEERQSQSIKTKNYITKKTRPDCCSRLDLKDKKRMKRKKTEAKNPDACLPISEVKKKKKKKDDTIDAVDTTGCTNDELNCTKKSKGGEAASEVKKKKKKVKKEKNAHADTAESPDLMESCTNEKHDDKEEKDKNKQPVTTEKDSMEEEEDFEEEEELSPEERRVLERKLKKIRKKEEKKKQKELANSEKEESKSSTAQTQALGYLSCWSEKRDEWKFQKTRQVWLLQNMYDSEKVPDAHFSLLLSYLEGLQGVAREITTQKAEGLVRFGTGPEGEGGATGAQKRTQRAREVTQILS